MPTREELLAEARRLDLIEQANALDDKEMQSRKPVKEQTFSQAITQLAKPVEEFTSALTPRIPVISSLGEYLGDAAAAAFSDDPKAFQKNRAETMARNERRDAAYPAISGPADILGSFALPGAPFMKAAQGAGTLAKAGAGAANIASRLGYGAATSGAEAALTGKSTEEAINQSLGVGSVLEAAGLGLKGARKIAGPTMFGVPKDLETRYVERRDAINAATPENVRDEILSPVQDLRGKVGIEKSNVADVKKQVQIQSQRDFDTAKSTAKDFLASADPTPDQAIAVVDAAKNVRRNISEESGKAFGVLQQANVQIPMSRIKAHVTNKIKEGEVAGVQLGIAKGENEILQVLREDLKNLPNAMQAEDVKKLVMRIDAAIEDIYAKVGSGSGFVTKAERNLMDVRKYINENLMEIPEYAEVMRPLAKTVGMMNTFDDFFTSPVVAQKALKAAQKGDSFQMRALQGFDERAGTSFSKDLEAQKQAAIAGEKSVWDKFNEAEAARQAQIDAAKGRLGAAEATLKPVSNITPANAEAFARAAGSPNRPNIYRKEQLQHLDEFRDPNAVPLEQMVQDLSDMQAFEKGFTNGSRNVNLGSKSLGGLAGAGANLLKSGAGAVWEPLGGAVGAVFGGLADIMGPKVYKKILDLEMNPKFQRAAFALKQAAQKSPQSVLMTHYLLEKQDPDYKAYMEEP